MLAPALLSDRTGARRKARRFPLSVQSCLGFKVNEPRFAGIE